MPSLQAKARFSDSLILVIGHAEKTGIHRAEPGGQKWRLRRLPCHLHHKLHLSKFMNFEATHDLMGEKFMKILQRV